MRALKFTLDALVGFGTGFALGNSHIEREAVDIEIKKHLVLTKKCECENCKRLVEKADVFKRKLQGYTSSGGMAFAGLYGIINAVASGQTSAGINSAAVAFPFTLLGAAAAKLLNRYRDREKYVDLKIIKEIARGDRSVESLLTQEQVHAIRESVEKIEADTMSESGIERENFDKYLEPASSLLINSPRAYAPLVLEWSRKHMAEKMQRFALQKHLKDFYEDALPEGLSGIACGYLGERGNSKLRLYAREANMLNIGTIEWENVEAIQIDGRGTTMKVSVPKITTDESTTWTGDYRQLAEKAEGDKSSGVILYSSSLVVPEQFKKGIITQVFTDSYKRHVEEKRRATSSKANV